ncbi:MAG: UDP-N-acetylmuramoyl-L-alanine--D-glutamate ligase [Candidatus Pacebacteria bacterium]|nr:UDP-N-acetylmuramoyl-L-alanine--D-glutamate ligase [Candidatus Paceibacterota bacterium]
MTKSQYEQYFRGKHITIMGTATMSHDIEDIVFLANTGTNLVVTNLLPEEKLTKTLRQLKKYKNISYTLGGYRVRDFRNKDMIIKDAGISLENKYIETALKEGTPVHMSLAFVIDILKKENIKFTFIGVTGTKGKSTTLGLIEALLKKEQLPYHLAGNVKGVSNFSLLKKIKDGDIILAELDSWQLQGFNSLKISPHIAVFTNFFEDHMNYYNGSMKDYFKDKSAIFAHQGEDDFLVVTHGSQKAIKKYYKKTILSKKKIARFKNILKSWAIGIFGKHNEKNIAQAFEVGKLLGIPNAKIKEAFADFKGVEGRFQYLGSSKENILFFNDNNSTAPESTVLSLQSLKKQYPDKDIILLAGGFDKEAHYQNMAKYIARNIKYTLLFSGTATDKIRECFPPRSERFTEVINMKTAMNIALDHAEPGDIIILSPGAASFGVFKNEYERNDEFIKNVKTNLSK